MHLSHDRKSPNLHFSAQKCTKQPNLAAAFNSFGIFVICTRYSASPQVCLVKGWKCWYQNLSEGQFIPKFIPCPYITRNLRLFTDEINYRIVGVITAGSQPGNKSKFMEKYVLHLLQIEERGIN